MAATCVLQTRVDEETKEHAQKAFARRGMTVSEGLREALYREIGGTASATSRLNSVFSDADKKREAAGFSEPSVDSIVKFCDAAKQERAEKAGKIQW